MKRYLIAFVSIMALASCARFEGGRVNAVRLVSPETDAAFDLTDENPTFQWQVSGVIADGCNFVLSADPRGDVVKIFEMTPSSFKRIFDVEELDAVLAEWGYFSRQEATVYWRIEPKDKSITDYSGFRAISLRRLEARPIKIDSVSPDDKALIDLNNVDGVEFSWSGIEGVESYSLQFRSSSDDESIPMPATCSGIKATSVGISAEELNSMISTYKPSSPLASLNWRVVSDSKEIPAESNYRQIRIIRIGAEGIAAATDVLAFPGSRRAKLTWKINDPRTIKVVVTCAETKYEVPVSEEVEDYELVIENLDEGEHEFSLVSMDQYGYSSQAATIKAEIYDISKMENEFTAPVPVLEGPFREGAMIKIEGGDSRRTGSYLEYMSPDGTEKYTKEFEGSELTTIIPTGEMKPASEATLYSRFLPVENALDPVLVESPLTVYVPAYSMIALENCSHWPNPSDNNGILFGDMDNYNSSFPFTMLFDGITTNDLNMWHTSGSGLGGTTNAILENPVVLTLDLGNVVNLSSLVVWGRYGGTATKPCRDGNGSASNQSYWAYGAYNPRDFEVWGTTEMPADVDNEAKWAPLTGTWRTDGNWTKLADCSVKRPSGNTETGFWYDEGCADGAIPTAEDYEASAYGHEFAADMSAPAVRYVRIVITKTWNFYLKKRISFGELHFYEYEK